MQPLSTWLARMQWVLQSGAPVADALVYPLRSNPPDGPYTQAADQPASALNAIDAASPYTLSRLCCARLGMAHSFNRAPTGSAWEAVSHALPVGARLTNAAFGRNPNHLTTDDTDDTNKKHP